MCRCTGHGALNLDLVVPDLIPLSSLSEGKSLQTHLEPIPGGAVGAEQLEAHNRLLIDVHLPLHSGLAGLQHGPLTIRSGSTVKVLAKSMLKYYRISQCRLSSIIIPCAIPRSPSLQDSACGRLMSSSHEAFFDTMRRMTGCAPRLTPSAFMPSSAVDLWSPYTGPFASLPSPTHNQRVLCAQQLQALVKGSAETALHQRSKTARCAWQPQELTEVLLRRVLRLPRLDPCPFLQGVALSGSQVPSSASAVVLVSVSASEPCTTPQDLEALPKVLAFKTLQEHAASKHRALKNLPRA